MIIPWSDSVAGRARQHTTTSKGNLINILSTIIYKFETKSPYFILLRRYKDTKKGGKERKNKRKTVGNCTSFPYVTLWTETKDMQYLLMYKTLQFIPYY